MMELMYLGKAIHVIPQTEEEYNLAQLLFMRGGLIGVGLDSLQIADASLRSKTSHIARRLIDGNGLTRIATSIESIL